MRLSKEFFAEAERSPEPGAGSTPSGGLGLLQSRELGPSITRPGTGMLLLMGMPAVTTRLDRPAPPPALDDPARLPRRPATPAARILLVAVNVAAIAFYLFSFRHGVRFAPYRIDLDVYRIGGRVWLGHGDLYGALPATSSGVRLPFSYPPVAAVLLSPLVLAPLALDEILLTLLTIAVTALVLRVFLRSVAGPRAGSWWTLGWLLPVALFLEPVRSTLGYGQINVALIALVSLDCLPASVRWPRGMLVGLAAAVKLTPAVFV